MARVFLSVGSNWGDRCSVLEVALQRLGAAGSVRVVACSQVYETEPWPEERQPRERWFLNCAVEIETLLPPRQLLRLTQEIEALATAAGPPPVPAPDALRGLDIDILLYDDRVVSTESLQIPHPMLHERRFVLGPLSEIAPEFEHPTLYESIRGLLDALVDERGIFPYR